MTGERKFTIHYQSRGETEVREHPIRCRSFWHAQQMLYPVMQAMDANYGAVRDDCRRAMFWITYSL